MNPTGVLENSKATKNPLQELLEYGQSMWLDYIRRDLFTTGKLNQMIANDGLRGQKSDIWDGGHRVPFIVRWPGKVKAGSTTGEIICLTYFLATAAAIIGTGSRPVSAIRPAKTETHAAGP